MRAARYVLAGHADERAGEVGQARRRRLVREDARVEVFGQPAPGAVALPVTEVQPDKYKREFAAEVYETFLYAAARVIGDEKV
jgi:hypothetical protein